MSVHGGRQHYSGRKLDSAPAVPNDHPQVSADFPTSGIQMFVLRLAMKQIDLLASNLIYK